MPRLLDVELVVDENINAQPFWGKTGHYSLATFACGQVTAPKLSTLMTVNRDRISFAIAELSPADIDRATKDAKKQGSFVPLADVPDVIWKNLPTQVPGGRDTAPRSGPEHPAHYADIDEPGPDGKTLRELCVTDRANVTVPRPADRAGSARRQTCGEHDGSGLGSPDQCAVLGLRKDEEDDRRTHHRTEQPYSP